MKKTLFASIIGLASMMAFGGAQNVCVTFATQGPDKYADGETVKKGECYALVWKQSDATEFKAFADGTVAEGCKVVLVYQTKEAGRCNKVLFQVGEDYLTANGMLDKGVWAVYLLDTRKADGSLAAIDQKTGLPKVINAIESYTGAASIKTSDGNIVQSKAGEAKGDVASSAVPADTPAPIIKSVEIKGDKVYITFSNSVPYLQYDVASGSDVKDDFESGKAENAAQGAESKDTLVTLITPKTDDTQFFKVNRK